MSNEKDFIEMPEVPQKYFDEQNERFTSYLFFKTIKPGVRKYTCSHCGKTFETNRNELPRLVTPDYWNYSTAKPGTELKCPKCGKYATVTNVKRCNFRKLSEEYFIVFAIKKSYNEVWFRGFNVYKNYVRWEQIGYKEILTPKLECSECYRYKLTPGDARQWKKFWRNEDFYECATKTDAFVWNNGGFCCEKHDYYLVFCSDTESINDTFLKYNSFNSYSYPEQYMKYLSLYAVHPQIEMLVKIGLDRVVQALMLNNSDYPRFINWNASKPWEMFGLNHQQYNEWNAECDYSFDALKLYKYLKYESLKDFKKVNEIINFFDIDSYYYGRSSGINKVKSINKLANREGKTVYDAIQYFKKTARNSGGMCHHCPGITDNEAYSMWQDYIDMLPQDNKNLPLFPHDLKRRHDLAMEAKNKEIAKAAQKERMKRLKMLSDKAEKEFPKVNKTLQSIKDKYSYIGEKYSIVVPENLKELIAESIKLDLCIHTAPTGRYYDRIERNETYIFFLRKNEKPKEEYYIIEAEPDGTLRQKRTYHDSQNETDINDFLPFIREWQAELKKRLTKKDRKNIAESKRLRKEGFDDLRKTKKTINYGEHRGELLADVLERDLFEAG